MVTFTSPMVQFPSLGASLKELVGLPTLGAGTYSSSNVYRSTAPASLNLLAAVELLQRKDADVEIDPEQQKEAKYDDN